MSGGRRLTLVVPSLQYGGAERVVARMATHWAAHGQRVTVITLSGCEGDTYPVGDGVVRVALGLMRESRGPIQAIQHNIARIRRLRQEIARSNPDTVISFTDRMNVITVLACRPLGVDTVIAERIDPGRQEIGRVWSCLRRRVYPSARALVVQTERVARQMAPVMRGRPIYVVPNAVWTPQVGQRPPKKEGQSPRTMIAMGRLSRQKGFDLLIDAFARIADRHPDWFLRIVGEGPERGALEERARSHGWSYRVRLTGWESNPAAALASADLFVLSSRFEGFPNALLEAMACGLPVISFDCDSGPAEIIREGVDGLLVPPEDVGRLAETMERVMGDDSLRRRLGDAARKVVERFRVETYFQQWEGILEKRAPV